MKFTAIKQFTVHIYQHCYYKKCSLLTSACSPMLFKSESLNGHVTMKWNSSRFMPYHLLINLPVLSRDKAIPEFAVPKHMESADSWSLKRTRVCGWLSW